MKQILSFNEEYLDNVALAVPEDSDPVQFFREHVIKRAMELLYVSREEAERLLSASEEGSEEESDGLHYAEHNDDANASIMYSGGYIEYLSLSDIPCCPTSSLQLETSAGILTAYKYDDPFMPEIDIMLKPAAYEDEIQIAMVGSFKPLATVNSAGYRNPVKPGDVFVRVYSDPGSEDCDEPETLITRDAVVAALGTARHL